MIEHLTKGRPFPKIKNHVKPCESLWIYFLLCHHAENSGSEAYGEMAEHGGSTGYRGITGPSLDSAFRMGPKAWPLLTLVWYGKILVFVGCSIT